MSPSSASDGCVRGGGDGSTNNFLFLIKAAGGPDKNLSHSTVQSLPGSFCFFFFFVPTFEPEHVALSHSAPPHSVNTIIHPPTHSLTCRLLPPASQWVSKVDVSMATKQVNRGGDKALTYTHKGEATVSVQPDNLMEILNFVFDKQTLN